MGFKERKKSQRLFPMQQLKKKKTAFGKNKQTNKVLCNELVLSQYSRPGTYILTSSLMEKRKPHQWACLLKACFRLEGKKKKTLMYILNIYTLVIYTSFRNLEIRFQDSRERQREQQEKLKSFLKAERKHPHP